MAAIDLLLNWSPNSERMHQVVLACLLGKTSLLRKLGISEDATDGLATETQGRLFDFTIPVVTGEKVHVELKLDAELGENQMARQMAALGTSDRLLYLLLGATQFCCQKSDIERICRQQNVRKNAVTIVDLATLIDAVRSSVVEANTPDERDLAAAYVSLLQKIQASYNAFENKKCVEWEGSDWFGFYSQLRTKLDLQDCGMAYVPNQTGGFYGCWWGFVPLRGEDGCKVYLQLEQVKLCFKLAVDDRGRASTLRNRFSDAVLDAAATTGLDVRRPARFGTGTWMTVAVFNCNYWAPEMGDKLNWQYTASVIAGAQKVLGIAATEYQPE